MEFGTQTNSKWATFQATTGILESEKLQSGLGLFVHYALVQLVRRMKKKNRKKSETEKPKKILGWKKILRQEDETNITWKNKHKNEPKIWAV